MEEDSYLTLKVQIYPKSKACRLMDRTIEVSGYVYNAFIYVGRYYRIHYNRFPSKNDLRGLVTKFWKNCPWMHDIPNNSLFEQADNAIRSLKSCFQNFKDKKGPILPKYRKREFFCSFGFISHENFEIFDIVENGKRKRYLYLRKMGDIRARNLQDFPPGDPKTCHVRRERKGGHYEYFATINYQTDGKYEKDEYNLETYHRSPQGIDIGIAKVATLSNGKEYPNKNFQREDKELAKLHQKLSKCPRNSPEFEKIRAKISHRYVKITNRRANETYVSSKKIVYENDQLFAEDLSISQLRDIAYSHNMRLQYADANLGKFMQRLDVLSSAAGRPIKYVDYAYSSQTCSKCGELVQKKLEDRIHECPHCGLVIDRDQNAAINILNWGLARNPSALEKRGIRCTWLEPSSENA